MARTKQTARKDGEGPKIASLAASKGKKSRKGKPEHMFVKKYRRVKQNVRALKEIRAAQKACELCIYKAPFRRVVRDVSDQCVDNLRWYTTALDCIQEAAEDYLIEFFIDAIMLAAHAHRVTLMERDTHTLGMLRHRTDNLCHPVDFVDTKMRDILLIPPYRKPKITMKITEVYEEDLHDRVTRLNILKKEQLEEQQKLKKKEVKDDEPSKKLKAKVLKKEDSPKKGPRRLQLEEIHRKQTLINNSILKLHSEVKVEITEEGKIYHRAISNDDLNIFLSPDKEVNDNVIFCALW